MAKKSIRQAVLKASKALTGSSRNTQATNTAITVATHLLTLRKYVLFGVIAIVALAVLLIGGVVQGIGNTLNNVGGDTVACGVSTSTRLILEAEAQGLPITKEQEDALRAAGQASAACSGVGYTGQTYPPTAGRITGFYGEVAAIRNSNAHSGLDIAYTCGSPIYAFAGGTVTSVILGTEKKSTSSQYMYPMGMVTIQHTPEFTSSYWHLKGSTTTVRIGDVVNAGDVIADQWSNGRSTGCHLHLEMYSNGKRTDPLPVLLEAGYPYDKVNYYLEKDFPPVPDPNEVNPSPSPTPGPTEPPVVSVTAQSVALGLLPNYGWTLTEFNNCLVPLWENVSGWRVTAQNNNFDSDKPKTPENQAYGIAQAAPGSVMADVGDNWKTSARTQIVWGFNKITETYGDPCVAWEHYQTNNWY